MRAAIEADLSVFKGKLSKKRDHMQKYVDANDIKEG